MRQMKLKLDRKNITVEGFFKMERNTQKEHIC